MLTVTNEHFKICIPRTRTKLCKRPTKGSIQLQNSLPLVAPDTTCDINWIPCCHVRGDAQTSYSYTKARLIAIQFSCLPIINDGPNSTVQGAVVQWCKQQPKEFFPDGILRLVHQCDPCLPVRGNLLQYLHFQHPQMASSCTWSHIKEHTNFHSHDHQNL